MFHICSTEQTETTCPIGPIGVLNQHVRTKMGRDTVAGETKPFFTAGCKSPTLRTPAYRLRWDNCIVIDSFCARTTFRQSLYGATGAVLSISIAHMAVCSALWLLWGRLSHWVSGTLSLLTSQAARFLAGFCEDPSGGGESSTSTAAPSAKIHAGLWSCSEDGKCDGCVVFLV